MTVIMPTPEQLRASVIRVLQKRVKELEDAVKNPRAFGQQVDPSFYYNQFVKLVEEDLKDQTKGTVISPSGIPLRVTEHQLSHKEKQLVRWVVWELIITGILIPGAAEGDSMDALNLPRFTLTQQALDQLSGKDATPFDPLGFIKAIDALPHISDVTKLYAREAIMSFQRGLLIASLATIGAANEALFTSLYSSAQTGIIDSVEQGKLNKSQDEFISKRMTVLESVLQVKNNSIDPDIYEKVTNHIRKIVDVVRITRNNSMHPVKPRHYDRGFVLAHLAMFTSVVTHVDEVIDYFQTHKIT